MTGIRIIKIFLASSSELKDDREQFEIFINRKNKEYIRKSIFLELVIWEDFLDAMSATRLQDEYNNAITDCDVFVSLFKTKVGRYTEEEFTQAFKTFKTNNRPFIYTYFQDFQVSVSQVNIEDLISLNNFKDKLGQLGHFHTIYKNIDDLKHRFSDQLNKFLPKLADNLLEIPISDRSQLDEIEKLKQELKDTERSHIQQLGEIERSQIEQQEDLKQSLQSEITKLEQELQQARSHQQQLEIERSQIEQQEELKQSLQSEITQLEQELQQARSHIQQLEALHQSQIGKKDSEITRLLEEKKELKQSLQSQMSQIEQQLVYEKLCFTKQQVNLQTAQEKITEKESIIAQLHGQIKLLKYDPQRLGYSNIRDLLEQKKWKEADQETAKVMLDVANRISEGCLSESDIDKFPCEHLHAINRLWLHYSDGKFGFSVQKEIYESLGGAGYNSGYNYYHENVWNSFGDRVGWRKGRNWLNWDEITNNLESAPKAHLPSVIMVTRGISLQNAYYRGRIFFSRAKTCNL